MLIEIRNIVKTFEKAGEKVPVLRGVDLTVEAGDTISIMGPSGAGKSTLLHIIGGLERPSSGVVLYRGQDIFTLDNGGLAVFRGRNVGFVFQFHHLLPEFSALENVMMPGIIAGEDRTLLRRRAESLLQIIGLGNRMKHRPGELSGGEQQRVALARALVMEPALVLTDEPTGNLDEEREEEIHELMERLNEELGTTFIVVTHNQLLARRMKRKFLLHNGRLEALKEI